MIFQDMIEYAQGVMLLEEIEMSRAPTPMTDQAGMQKYNKAVESQLDGIWDMMFPKTQEAVEADEEARKEFISRRGLYKELANKINQRG